jgi:hypothetical protein
MTALRFAVSDPRPANEMAAPGVLFRLTVQNEQLVARVHTLALRCQVQIEPRARRHTPEEQEGLREIFGAPDQWSRTLRPLIWAHVSTVVPAFTDSTAIDLTVPCTYDFQVAAAKYLHVIRDGVIPLRFLFSGSAFLLEAERFRIEPVSWDADATFSMPATVWQAAIDRFFPDAAWLFVRRTTLDALHTFRTSRGLASWDEVLEQLLDKAPARRFA